MKTKERAAGWLRRAVLLLAGAGLLPAPAALAQTRGYWVTVGPGVAIRVLAPEARQAEEALFGPAPEAQQTVPAAEQPEDPAATTLQMEQRRRLKLELLHHPQPDAVLTAMNRNLQIRLDILDQQLHLGTAPEAVPNPGAYVLADSRHSAE